MKRQLSIINVSVVAALALGVAACGDDDSSDSAPATEAAASESTEAPATESTAAPADDASSEATPPELCTAIDEVEMAIDAIDGDDLDQIQAQIDVVQAEFDEVREVAGDQYMEELDTMAAALQQFQDALAELAGGDALGGLLGMADAVAELAAAGEILDEQIDCPADFNDDADAAEDELDEELDEEEEELEEELED